MGRDARIQVYVSEERKERLSEQAQAADQSCSEYCRQLIAEHIDQAQDEQQYRRYGVDQQIELVLNEIRDETMALLSDFQSETMARVEEIQYIRTIYTIALWRLAEDSYPLSEREEALKRAAEYVDGELTDDPEIQSLLGDHQLPDSEATTETASRGHPNTSGGDS